MALGALRRLGAAALALLAGCDDGTIVTLVDAGQARLARSFLVTAGPQGFPVEIHGAPFAGVAPAEVAARLRAPASFPAGIRFRAVEPGAEGRRLVLVFNRDGPPDRHADCRMTAPASGRAPRDVGFSVSATLCSGAGYVVTGHMEARKTRADDPDEFARVMRLLLTTITEGA
jgi:hypothetical protein